MDALSFARPSSVTAAGATAVGTLSLEDDAKMSFSSIETPEAALYRMRMFANYPLPRLIDFMRSVSGQREVKEAFQIDKDVELQRIAIVGFGKMILVVWQAVTSVEGINWVPESTPNADGYSGIRTLVDARRVNEDFKDFCTEQMKTLAMIAAHNLMEERRVGVLEACCEVLTDVLSLYQQGSS